MYRTRLAPQPNGRSRFFRTFSFLHESCFPNPQTPFRVTLFFLLLLIAYLFPLTGKRRTKTPPKTNKKRGGKKESDAIQNFSLLRSFSFYRLFIYKGGTRVETRHRIYRKYFSRETIFARPIIKRKTRSWNISDTHT